MENNIFFADETKNELEEVKKFWKILIADDERDVHIVTKMVLNDLEFSGRKMEFLSAYSAEETKEIIDKNPDIALVLLDVVMEQDDSGLKIVKYIREEKKNKFIRIILRTGQPGKAPEKRIIMDYDINDYKEKTELTFQKLYTTIIASLRSYQDIHTIDRSRNGLEKIVKSSATMFELRSLKNFALGVLTQLTSLLGFDDSSFYMHSSGFTITEKQGKFLILAGTGEYSDYIDKPVESVVSEEVYQKLRTSIENKVTIIESKLYIGYFETQNNSVNLVYMQGKQKINEIDKELLEIFSTNVAIAFDNIFLNQELEETQKELIFTLGEVVESRSHEIGNHVKRVAAYACLLADLYGLSSEKVMLLKLAAPMHDVGKIGIPDSILFKPSRLTKEEYEIIQSHSRIGYDILKSSHRKILEVASQIALQHHERWDGLGYPNGLKGEEISIYARITGLVDIFDALLHKRIYKEKWSIDHVLEFISEQSGKRFDPNLVSIFLKNLNDFMKISEKYPD